MFGQERTLLGLFSGYLTGAVKSMCKVLSKMRGLASCHSSRTVGFGTSAIIVKTLPPARLPLVVAHGATSGPAVLGLLIAHPATTKCNLLALFPRNVEPHPVGFENRRDLGEFLTGAGATKTN